MSAPQDSQQAPDDAEQVPVVTAADGRRFVPVMTQGPASSTSEETDTVLEALAGNYTQDVVDEVRQYGKPEWEVTESSTLDPIDDIETMYAYDFKLPPKVHDQYVGAAAGEIKDLENMKGEVDPETLAKYEQRRKLTEGRHAEDIKWMKHKAYYRGMQKIRAVKKQLQQAAEEDAQDATADSSTTAANDSKHQQQPAVQQPQQRLSHYSEAEVLAEISDPSEWDQSWVSPSYQQHPEVLQQLRSSFAKCFDLPYVSPQQQQEQELQLQQALAAQQAAKQRAAELERAKEAFLAKHSPYQVGSQFVPVINGC